ncbi:MAG: hypothetical protein V3V05_13135 [Pontiella sp.]
MCHKIVIGAISIALLTGVANAEMHAFSLKDGRVLEAEVVDYSATLGKVTLKRADGKKIPVQTGIFVEADQAYIREWDAAKAFTSDRFLKISCDSEVTKKWKEEIYKDIRDTEGNVEEHLVKEIKYEDVAYEIEFKNTGKTPVDNVRIEYRIYYEQSRESRESPISEQYIFSGKSELPSLAGSGTTFLSDAVMVYADNISGIDWADGSSRVGGKGEVNGFRAKLYLKTASGKEIMREFCDPATLSTSKFPWKDGTGKPPKPVDAGKGRKKS